MSCLFAEWNIAAHKAAKSQAANKLTIYTIAYQIVHIMEAHDLHQLSILGNLIQIFD